MCKKEFAAMQEALENYGPDSTQYRDALGTYLICYGELVRGREGHSGDWDEKLYLLQKELQEAWEQLTGRVDIPPKPTCGKRSIEARAQIFESRKNAMVFSMKMEEAFQETGIKLKKGETYACTVCIVKKPRYRSEALSMDPLGQNRSGSLRLNYIMEPVIMESVMKMIEEDKIRYKSKIDK